MGLVLWATLRSLAFPTKKWGLHSKHLKRRRNHVICVFSKVILVIGEVGEVREARAEVGRAASVCVCVY